MTATSDNGNKPAHPYTGKKIISVPHTYNKGLPNQFEGRKILSSENIEESGMTKREAFAMAAMHGLMSCLMPVSDNQARPNLENITYMVKLSVTAADELLKQLES